MTTDLVTWLHAQLDDDERIALAAGERSRNWHADGSGHDRGAVEHDGESPYPIVYDEGYPTEAEAAHMARHDPARVLAEVDAKRRIIEEHYPTDPCDAHDAELRSIPCDTVRLLALPYADREGYDERWRP